MPPNSDSLFIPANTQTTTPRRLKSSPVTQTNPQSLFIQTVRGIPASATNLFKSSVKQTGKGLGIIADAISPDEQDLPKVKLPSGKEVALDPTGTIGAVRRTTELAAQEAPKAFQGFSDLSTKLLEMLKGRTTVPRQFIEDLAKQPGIKAPDRELLAKTAAEFAPTPKDPVPVTDLAERVREGLLPLSRNKVGTGPDFEGYYNPHESTTLKEELRGPVANYSEHVYESPVVTSAGSTHFSTVDHPNYFAHTRVEDLARGPYESADSLGGTGGTRRVIEVQSDLFQKGRLEGEAANRARAEYNEVLKTDDAANVMGPNGQIMTKAEALATYGKNLNPNQETALAKLEPYRNTWHERVIREEVKKAAQDGKTKLQFPVNAGASATEPVPRLHTREGAVRRGGLDEKRCAVAQEDGAHSEDA